MASGLARGVPPLSLPLLASLDPSHHARCAPTTPVTPSRDADHADHEVQVLHRVLPSSAAPSPQAKRAPSRVRSRRNSSSGEELLPAPGDLASSKLKSNSTSTLFVDSTVSAPNMDETLRCVALALHYIIKDGHTVENANLYLSKFDESRFPLTDKRVPRDYYKQIPEDDDIYLFIHRLFHAAALTVECAIITLVYEPASFFRPVPRPPAQASPHSSIFAPHILARSFFDENAPVSHHGHCPSPTRTRRYVNRVVAYTDLTIQASTWKRVVLGAILMASKVWDDQAVWNVDFCSILPRIDVEDMYALFRAGIATACQGWSGLSPSSGARGASAWRYGGSFRSRCAGTDS